MNNFEQDVKNSLTACWESIFYDNSILQQSIMNFYLEQIKNFSQQEECFLSYFNYMDFNEENEEFEICSMDDMTINAFGKNTSTIFHIYFILLNKNRLNFIRFLIEEMKNDTCFELPVYFICQCDFCNFTKEEQALLKKLNDTCNIKLNDLEGHWCQNSYSRIEEFNKNKEELLKEREDYDQLSLWDMAMYS